MPRGKATRKTAGNRARKAPPSRFTKECRDLIIQAVRAGNSMTVACRAAGIERRTVYNWLAEGRAKGATEAKRQFYRDVHRARALCLQEAAKAVRKAALGQVITEVTEEYADVDAEFRQSASEKLGIEPEKVCVRKIVKKKVVRDWRAAHLFLRAHDRRTWGDKVAVKAKHDGKVDVEHSGAVKLYAHTNPVDAL